MSVEFKSHTITTKSHVHDNWIQYNGSYSEIKVKCFMSKNMSLLMPFLISNIVEIKAQNCYNHVIHYNTIRMYFTLV